MPEKVKLKLDKTVQKFIEQHKTGCAATSLTFWQHCRYQLILWSLFLFFCYDYKLFAAFILFLLTAFYGVTIAYRLLIIGLSLLFKPEIKISQAELADLNDDELPIYTILIPMYKEPEVADKIIRAMNQLDYPSEKLDVKLLLEEDDSETVQLCQSLDLPECIELLIVPHAMPKTKPKACNHGLLKAKGEFLVIYDAEDMPDSNQLRKAVAGFLKMPEKVVCLQAKLNYYNPYQNTLTKWFTLEYSAWFDLFLPGLHAIDAPIPLGGTSNHFRTEVLQELGGWDPFNLTEDCDLGIRLHKHGWRSAVLDSTTWEEANSQVGNWLRQRSRWVKGYIQTHFVHVRSNIKTIQQLGPHGYASFIFTVGGLSLTLLLNPLFWIIGLTYLALAVGNIYELTPPPWQMIYNDRVADLPGSPLTQWSQLSHLFWFAAIALLSANAVFVIINLIACCGRKMWRLIPYALISPLYWIFISIAAWKGFLQLFSKPFYWEKTQHGLGEPDKKTDNISE